jgi:hypothetical protein
MGRRIESLKKNEGGTMFSEISEATKILVVLAVMGVFVFFGMLRIFIIDKTLREILEILKMRTEKKD